MKIAVISDIHGNLEALKAVLEDIKQEGCEKIFALGDYAMAGPQPVEIVDWFMQNSEKENITMIQGNTDFMIANYNEELFQNIFSKAPVMAEALKNDVVILNDEQKLFLKNLPVQKSVEEEGVKILLVHGSPRKNNEDIMPNTSMDLLSEMLEGINEDIVLCGHTHLPCGFQTPNKKTVVNVGSVGRPFTPEPKSCYLKMTLINGKVVFEHRFVEYNNEVAANKLRERNFNGVEKLAKTLLDPQERHF